MLEPCEVKVSRTVLEGPGDSNVQKELCSPRLPGIFRKKRDSLPIVMVVWWDL